MHRREPRSNFRDCKHCGALLEKTARVKGSCRNNITVVAVCDLHGECTPYDPSNCRKIQACQDCQDYRAK